MSVVAVTVIGWVLANSAAGMRPVSAYAVPTPVMAMTVRQSVTAAMVCFHGLFMGVPLLSSCPWYAKGRAPACVKQSSCLHPLFVCALCGTHGWDGAVPAAATGWRCPTLVWRRRPVAAGPPLYASNMQNATPEHGVAFPCMAMGPVRRWGQTAWR